MSRADRVAARLAERELDLLLVTDLVNLRYLTGFTGTNGLAVVGPDTRRFLTDFRYVERAKAEVAGFDLQPAPQELRAALAEGWPPARCASGFEDQHVSVRRHAELRDTLPDRLELVAAGGLVEAERALKEPGEVAAIRAAAALVDEIYAWVRERGLVGRTERDVALALEQEMRLRGAEGPSFPSIVAAEENGALPHATPRDVPIPAGTLVTLDIGAKLDGYCSDCTRTWATGPLPDDLEALYGLVLEAQEAALDAVRPGPAGARGRRRRARPDRGRRARRSLRARARPRGRARHPRGPAAGPHRGRAARGGERRDRRAGRLRARPRRGADRGSRRRHRGRARRAERHPEVAHRGGVETPSPARGPSRVRRHRPIPGAMELRARIPSPLRRAAFVAALVALAAPATAGAATTAKAAKKKVKAPVVTKVSPLDVAVGESLTIRGRHFVAGRYKNTVVFKRDGARAVFAKADVGTKKMLVIKVPASLQEFFSLNSGEPIPTRFRIRVLAKKFGKKFTKNKLSPTVSAPRPPRSVAPTESTPDGDCDGDGAKNKADGDDDNDGLADDVELSLSLDPCVADTDEDGVLDKWEFDCDRDAILNRDETDDDDDLLSDTLETAIGTDPCNADSDGDKVADGYEYQSAVDLNDDEFQHPNTALPYPGKRPYPNPLFADADLDYDGDTLTSKEEYDLWIYTYSVTKTDPRSLSQLSYSAGQQYSRSRIIPSGDDAGRHEPTLSRVNYNKHDQFITWATARAGYRTVRLDDLEPWWDHAASRNPYGLFDMNRYGGEQAASNFAVGSPPFSYTARVFYQSEVVLLRPLPGRVPLRRRARRGRRRPHELRRDARPHDPRVLEGLLPQGEAVPHRVRRHEPRGADTDGDGVRDGADDQDHDDIPNIMELSRNAAPVSTTRKNGDRLRRPGRAAAARATTGTRTPTAGSTRSTRASRTGCRGPARSSSNDGHGRPVRRLAQLVRRSN